MTYGNFPYSRMRRRRQKESIRNLIAETIILPQDLIQPFFVIEGNNLSEKIEFMPGINRLSIDIIIKEIQEIMDLGINNIILFPCINKTKKNIDAKESYNENGLIQECIYKIKNKYPNLTIISDIALDPYPISEYMISTLNKLILTEDLSIFLQMTSDNVNDASDEIKNSNLVQK